MKLDDFDAGGTNPSCHITLLRATALVKKEDTSDQIGIHSKFLPQRFQVIPPQPVGCNKSCWHSDAAVMWMLVRKGAGKAAIPLSTQAASVGKRGHLEWTSIFVWERRVSRERRSPFLIQFTLLIDFCNYRCVPRSEKAKHTYNKMLKTLLPIYILFF